MTLSDIQKKVKQYEIDKEIDKKIAKRQLWIEYAKGTVIVLVFLAGVALVSNIINIYFAVEYGFGLRPWYSNFVLLFGIVAYIGLFVSGYKKLGLKVTDKIDDLKTVINGLD